MNVWSPSIAQTSSNKFELFVLPDYCILDPGTGPIGSVPRFRAKRQYVRVRSSHMDPIGGKNDFLDTRQNKRFKVRPSNAGVLNCLPSARTMLLEELPARLFKIMVFSISRKSTSRSLGDMLSCS